MPKEDKKRVNKKIASNLGAASGSILYSTVMSMFEILFLNVGLHYIQKTVNGKFLVNYVDKKFTSKIKDTEKFSELALKMRAEHKLADKVKFLKSYKPDAYFNPNNNTIVLGEKQLSAVFHELGHAVIENNTKFLKRLQQGRGNYLSLAILLNILIMMHN